MTMPQATSTSPHDPSTPAVVRLVDTGGSDGPATRRELAGRLHAGTFLPLSFLTGYVGMNFRVLTDAPTTLWQFILLGLLLPIASAGLSLLLIRGLERRFGIGRLGQRKS